MLNNEQNSIKNFNQKNLEKPETLKPETLNRKQKMLKRLEKHKP